MAKRHLLGDVGLEPDEEGEYAATCTCGWDFGPLYAPESVVDVLMDHAAGEAFITAAKERND